MASQKKLGHGSSFKETGRKIECFVITHSELRPFNDANKNFV